MNKEDESWVHSIPFIDGYGIRRPSYTYWNLAYALTFKGGHFIFVLILDMSKISIIYFNIKALKNFCYRIL